MVMCTSRMLILWIVCCTILAASRKYTICTTDRYAFACQELNKSGKIKCIVMEDEASCVAKVSQGDAQLTSISPEAAFAATSKSSLVTLATFKSPTESNSNSYQISIYSNRNITNGLKDLTNFSYCHPGLDSPDVNPLIFTNFETQVLITNEINICTDPKMPMMEEHLKAIHDYFGPSCISGRWTTNTELDIELKQKYPKLTQLCTTTSYKNNTETAFMQALKCAMNSKTSAIALTTISTIEDLQQIEDFSPNTICRNGTISNTELCAWASVPHKIVIGNRNTIGDLSVELEDWFPKFASRKLLSERINFSDEETEYLREMLFPNPSDTNYKIILPTAKVPSLNQTLAAYSDNLMVNQSKQCESEIKWCTISSNEQQKCEAWSNASLSSIQPTLECVQKPSKIDCIEAIKTGEADVVTIDADLGYFAIMNDLEMIAFVESNEQLAIRTALVVQSNIRSFQSLKNKRGCFATYCDAACMSFISVSRGILFDNETSPRLLNKILGGSCVPEAGFPKKENKVSSTTEDGCTTDKYYGNQGALNCLKEAGDFAVITKTDGLLLPENARILCKNGSLAGDSLEVDDHCFLSVIIPQTIVARRGDSKNRDIQEMVKDSERRFVDNVNAPFKLFAAFNGVPDLLFKSSALGVELNNSRNHLVKNYQRLYEYVEGDRNKSSPLKIPPFILISFILVIKYYMQY